jgi:hypothetical protein
MLRLRLVLAPLLCLTSSGCFGFTVRSENVQPTPYQSKTVHAYLWNLIEMEPVVVATNCGSNGISAVRANTNYLFMLVGIVTLGLWVPMHVEWRCAEGGSR